MRTAAVASLARRWSCRPYSARTIVHAAEGVGHQEVGAGLEILAVHLGDDVGAGDVEVLGAAFVLGAAVVGGREIEALQVRAARALLDEDASSAALRAAV